MLSASQILPAMNTEFTINACDTGSVTRPPTSSIDAPSVEIAVLDDFAKKTAYIA